MAISNFEPNYFLKDYETLREELIRRIPIVSGGKITDLNESSVTVTLVELFAAIGDMLAYYIDSSAREAFISTARQPNNIYRLADMLGYKIREITSASAEVQFSIITANPTDDVIIPKGTRISTTTSGGTSGGGFFVTQEPTMISRGTTSAPNTVLAKQGIPGSTTYTADASADQSFTITTRNIDPTTISLYNGTTAWTPVDNFLYSNQNDKHFRVKTDYLGNTTVYFSDGINGRAPSNGVTFSVDYLVSAGAKGNVGAGAISTVISTLFTAGSNGQTVTAVDGVSVTNPSPAAGGSSRESLERVKTNLPNSLGALYRPLTKGDYLSLVNRIGGVLRSNIWGEQEEGAPSYENFNWVNIVLVPEGGGTPSSNLIETVTNYLEEIQPITIRMRFIDPEYINLDITASIKSSPGSSIEAVRLDADEAIREFLDLTNVRFGQDIRVSDIYRILLDIEGVEYANVNDIDKRDSEGAVAETGAEIILQKWEIPQLNNLTLTVSEATELPIPDEYPDETI